VRDDALQKLTKHLEDGHWVEARKAESLTAAEREALKDEIAMFKRKLLRMLWEGLFFGRRPLANFLTIAYWHSDKLAYQSEIA
jgi:hypothetical protein